MVVGVVSADNHLGGLAGGGEGFGLVGGRDVFVATGFFVFLNTLTNAAHGLAGAAEVFFGSEGGKAFLCRKFDVDTNTVSIFSGLVDEFLRGFRNGFEVDVAAEMMVFAKGARDLVDLLHGVIGIANNTGAEEEAFDVVALVEVEGELDDFLGSEPGTRGVAGAPVDAVVAIVDAGVSQENLEEGDAPAIGGIAVANPCAAGRAESFGVFSRRVALVGAAAGTRGIVFGGVGEDGELFLEEQKRTRLLL